jgi:hypothetical protein
MTFGWTSQTGGAAAKGAPGTNADPFDPQSACWPVLTFDQRMLLTPFPLTSGVARIRQSSETVLGNHCAEIVNPSMIQASTAPSVVLRQRMSCLPAPVKSPNPAIFQSSGAKPESQRGQPFTYDFDVIRGVKIKIAHSRRSFSPRRVCSSIASAMTTIGVFSP